MGNLLSNPANVIILKAMEAQKIEDEEDRAHEQRSRSRNANRPRNRGYALGEVAALSDRE